VIEATLRLPRAGFALDVDLRLPGRGVSALFGPSGCGKTTLLRALAGLERGTGRVAVDGEVWQDDARGLFVPAHRRPLGYVIQEAALFPHLDVQGNLDFARRRAGAARIALDPLVELLGIGALMRRRTGTLSGGERQRVAIARALACAPRLLLMDEPLAALDAARKAELLPYLERLQRELRLPVVYVSHALDEVARLAHHLVLMEQGRVVGHGALAELLARLDLPTAHGEGAGVVLDGVVTERDAQWQLARLEVGGGDFHVWARDTGLDVGRPLRVRLLARDISLARTRLEGSSIGNQIAARVESIADDEHPSLALVRVRVGASPLVARLTRRSAHLLQLAPGQPIWAQVKTVALLE